MGTIEEAFMVPGNTYFQKKKRSFVDGQQRHHAHRGHRGKYSLRFVLKIKYFLLLFLCKIKSNLAIL